MEGLDEIKNQDTLFIRNNQENSICNDKFKNKIFRIIISQYSLLLILVGRLNKKSKKFLSIILLCVSHIMQVHAGFG